MAQFWQLLVAQFLLHAVRAELRYLEMISPDVARRFQALLLRPDAEAGRHMIRCAPAVLPMHRHAASVRLSPVAQAIQYYIVSHFVPAAQLHGVDERPLSADIVSLAPHLAAPRCGPSCPVASSTFCMPAIKPGRSCGGGARRRDDVPGPRTEPQPHPCNRPGCGAVLLGAWTACEECPSAPEPLMQFTDGVSYHDGTESCYGPAFRGPYCRRRIYGCRAELGQAIVHSVDTLSPASYRALYSDATFAMLQARLAHAIDAERRAAQRDDRAPRDDTEAITRAYNAIPRHPAAYAAGMAAGLPSARDRGPLRAVAAQLHAEERARSILAAYQDEATARRWKVVWPYTDVCPAPNALRSLSAPEPEVAAVAAAMVLGAGGRPLPPVPPEQQRNEVVAGHTARDEVAVYDSAARADLDTIAFADARLGDGLEAELASVLHGMRVATAAEALRDAAAGWVALAPPPEIRPGGGARCGRNWTTSGALACTRRPWLTTQPPLAIRTCWAGSGPAWLRLNNSTSIGCANVPRRWQAATPKRTRL